MPFPISNLLRRVLPQIPPAPVQAGFIVLASGGSIATTTVVNMAVTAVVGGVETAPSNIATITTAAGSQQATSTWGRVPGATYNVYASTGVIGSNPPLKVASGITNTFYTWTGTAGSGSMPGSTGFAEVTATPGLMSAAIPGGQTASIQQVVLSNGSSDYGQVFLSISGTRVLTGVPVPPDSANGGQPTRIPLLTGLAAADWLSGYCTIPGVTIHVDGLLG